MGWTTTYKPKSEPILDFFIRQGVLTWGEDNPNTYRVLDSALVNLSTFYAAVEKTNKATGERQVWAAVILVRHYPKDLHYNFGWKDMDESMFPVECSCPERILKLLTPTDHQSSNEWRAACWANIEKRKARKNLPAGTVLKYGRNLLTIEGPCSWAKTRTLVWGPEGKLWSMSRSQILAAEIVSRPEQANTVPSNPG